MSKIIHKQFTDKNNISYISFVNSYKNDKIIYNIYNLTRDNTYTIFYLYHLVYNNDVFINYELLKEEKIKINDVLGYIDIINKFQKFIESFERRKKISKLVAEFK